MMKAIAWDMDGTLMDSEPLWGKATYEMAQRLGKKLTAEGRAKTVGGSFANTYAVCCANAGKPVDPDEQQHWYKWMIATMNHLFSTELTVDPRIIGLLDGLAQAGIPMALATNTPRVIAQPAIEVLGADHFAATVCGDEVERGKPAPDIYAKAVEHLGVYPHEVVAFEDSTAGMTAAAAAGCVTIGLTTPDTVVPEGAIALVDLLGGAPDGAARLPSLTSEKIHDLFDMATARLR